MRATDDGYSGHRGTGGVSVGQFASVASVTNYHADVLMYSHKTAVIANA